MNFHFLDPKVIRPLSYFGFTSSFWNININTLIYTWITMAGLLFLYLALKFLVKRPSIQLFIIIQKFLEYFNVTVKEGVGYIDREVVSFLMSLFIFTLLCNTAGVFPGMEEPSLDINTSLAISLCSFVFVQYQGIRYKGFRYFKKLSEPFFVFIPMNVVGLLAKIASMCFRLLGNMLGGAIILGLVNNIFKKFGIYYYVLVTVCLIFFVVGKKFNFSRIYLGKVQLLATIIVFFIAGVQTFFGLFEGALHAFVVTLLTSIYISGERSESPGH